LPAADTRPLFGGPAGVRSADFQPTGVTATVQGERLRLALPAGDPGGERRAVRFPLPAGAGDLSRFRHLEVALANPGATPVTFTFWALSGPGWGGVSTFSTSRSASGRETLAPGASGTFRLDLHARYPGPEPLTAAIDPAAIHTLALVFEPGRAPAILELESIHATGPAPAAPAAPPDAAPRRFRVPAVETGPPAPGRRVFQRLPGWEATDLTHVLTLPREWQPGRKYPVIVEYTGNVFYHKFCHSTGRTEQGNLASGLARGEGFLCLNLPFVSEDGRREQVDGWGDIAKTADYCLAALREAAERFGADPRAIFFTGFSRGSYAANYLALRADRLAAVWAGFLTRLNPGIAWPATKGRGWRGVDAGWNERAARLQGRPWFHQPDQLGPDVHVDVEFLEDRPSTVATRRWLRQQVERLTGATPGGTWP
jgi:hypothetical protein